MKKKKKDFYALNVCSVMIALIAVGVSAVFLPKPTVSEIEKRELAKKPQWTLSDWFSGKFAKEYDAYYADTFPSREKLVSIAGKLDAVKGLHPDDVRIHTTVPKEDTVNDLEKEDIQEQTPSLPTEETEQETEQQEEIPEEEYVPGNGLAGNGEGEQAGNIFLYQNMGLQIFGASESMSSRYAKAISSYAEELPGVQVYNLIAPSSIAFYLPEKYQKISGNQKENIDFVASQMSPKVCSVNAYDKIDEHKDEYLYFRTDHHWTARGAYQAYVAFCEAAGFTPVKLSQMEKKQIDGFLGTLYGQTQDAKLAQTPDFVEYFIPPTQTTTQRYLRGKANEPVDSSIFAEYATSGPNTYSVFLHGDFPLTHIKTDLHTGRKIMLVKESFGNAFAPFLVSHYDEVFIADQRYFEYGIVDFVKEHKITDLLFLNNIFAVNTKVRVNELEQIKNQSYSPYIPPKPPVVQQTKPAEPQEIPKAEEPEDTEKVTEKLPEETPKKKVIKKKSAEQKTTKTERKESEE